MDNDVIDLSSDDELCPSPKKKAKTVIPPPNIRLQSNRQLTIRTTKVINKPPIAGPKPNNTIILAPAKSSDLRRGTQSILLSNNNLRPSLIQTKINSPGLVTTMGKQQPVSSTSSNQRFQKKITTGEITILPINIKEPQRNESAPKLLLGSVKSDPKRSVIKPNCDSTNTAITKPSQLIKPAKRIAPTKISDNFTIRANSLEKSSDSDMLSLDSSAANDEASTSSIHQQNGLVTRPKDIEMAEPEKKRRKEEPETPLIPEMQSLIDACQVADKTDVMKMLIQRLIKYYRRVHPNFISSLSFRKRVKEAAKQVKDHPSVYVVQLKDILEELKQRRSNDINIVQVDEDDKPTEVPSTTGNKGNDEKVMRLSQALLKLKTLITENEQAEVDWDDEVNSNFLIMERYKKRACEIYTKICLLTGENTNAERLVKKPIRFRGTEYKEFNRKLEKFVNETQAFPDRYDVKRILEYCNNEYNYRLNKDTMDILATDAFVKIGNDLQKRRKTDLYEMVDYFTQNQSDPATQDPALRAKLDENLKKHKKKMNDVIDKFTRQDHGEDVEGGASTSNNISGNDTNNDISPNKKPAKAESTSHKVEIIDDDDDEVLNVSDEVVLVQDDSNVEDFFGEISRNLNAVPSDEISDALFQIESVESLHPSLFGDGL